MDCVFCKIIKGELPCSSVYENEHVKCILPQKMEVYGHTLIIPKQHFVSIWDIPSIQLHYLADSIKDLSLLFQKKINATGINVLHASGTDAGQSVPHFHFHIFPRFLGDGIDAWPRLPEKEYDKKELFQRLTAMDGK